MPCPNIINGTFKFVRFSFSLCPAALGRLWELLFTVFPILFQLLAPGYRYNNTLDACIRSTLRKYLFVFTHIGKYAVNNERIFIIKTKPALRQIKILHLYHHRPLSHLCQASRVCMPSAQMRTITAIIRCFWCDNEDDDAVRVDVLFSNL